MQTVLLAAGDGERIAPLSESTPKPLLPVAGEPLLSRTARAAVEAGATELVVVVPPYHRPFVRELGDSIAGVPLTYAVQPRPMGTAKGLVAAKRQLDGDFVVLCGDTLYDPDDVAALYEDVPSVAVTERTDDHSVRETGGEGQVLAGDGGPHDVEALGDADAGTYLGTGACSFPGEACEWTRVPTNDDGERDVSAMVERAAGQYDVRTVLVDEHVDVDQPWDLLEATERVLEEWAEDVGEPIVEGDVSDQARLHGAVRIEEGAEVRAGVVVEGPAIIEEGTTVGPNAHVRPYTCLGPDVTVGHSVEVSNSVVMAGCTLEHLSSVADSVLAPDVTFGASTRIANTRHDGDDVVARAGDEYRSTGRREFGVVVGEGTSTAVDTTLDAGITMPCNTTTTIGENVLEDP